MKFYWTYKQKIRGRSPEYKRLAAQLGFKFAEKDNEKISTFLKDISIFKKRNPHKRANNIVFKEIEEPLENIYFFDYYYVVSTGNSTAFFDQTIFFAQTKRLSLPEFELKPKSVFNKIGDYFGKKRMDLGDPYLSKKFLLKTASPKVLEWINHKDFIAFLKRNPKLVIHGVNYQLVMFQHKKLTPLALLETVYKDYYAAYNLFLKLTN